MSDEFIKVATKEIREEILGIGDILKSCHEDENISKNSENLQKHTHKIKGLAPMMGKSSMGILASVLDDILKQIMVGKRPSGIFDLMMVSYEKMVQNMKDNLDLGPQIEKVKNFYGGM